MSNTPEIFINSIPSSAKLYTYRPSIEKEAFNGFMSTKDRDNRRSSTESCDTAASCEDTYDLPKAYSQNNLGILSDFEDNRRSSASSNGTQIGSLTSLKSGNKSKKNSLLEPNKYKTEMCKKWQAIGSCPYGKKCRFAHGREELHEKVLSNKKKYKSERCQTFFATMTCPYGSRCLFAHEERCLKDILAEGHQTSAKSTLVCIKRLPCFARTSEEETYTESLLQKTLERDLNNILKASGN